MKFFYHPPARIVECVSEYTFSVLQNIKQTNKQTNKKQESKTAKKAQEKKIISLENLLKKNCGRPGNRFSRHPHFYKQE